MLFIVVYSHAEQIDIACGFIEKTDRGLQCEINNIFATNTSEIVIIESNQINQIEAVSFRQSELYTVPADLFRKFAHLKHLDVELTQLKEISADNFQNAIELKYFLARFNEITELRSRTFSSCPQLKFIVLQYNMLEFIDPSAFEGLQNLEALYLDYNKLKTLPLRVFHPLTGLIHFSLAYNNVTTIPDSLFEKNEKLETINLGHNLLTFFQAAQFESLPNLETLQLDHNQLKELDLRTCKSTEINVDKNQIKALELNKWTRFVSAWGNPIQKLSLHEHYGTGRNYNFSFTEVNEITFFVNENCCTPENLENFYILTQSFGDLGQKRLDVNDWRCKFLKTVGYQTPSGAVVNNVCSKIKLDDPIPSSEEITTTTETRLIPAVRINSLDDTTSTTMRTRESMERTDSSSDLFSGMNIETLPERERRTTIEPNPAFVEELFPTSEKPNFKLVGDSYYKVAKTKVVGWKDTAVKKWNDWFG